MSFKEIVQNVKTLLKRFIELCRNKWFRFGFWSVLYLLWVIWLENYWFLLGLGIIYDMHITKKVKWLFWKKKYAKGEKRNPLYDWLDAIIFAVIVVTFINTFFFQAFKIPTSSMESSLYAGDHLFVNKLAYGPRMPMTPLTIPFTHNVIGGSESYSTLIQWDYKRLKGFGTVQVGDYVVFNFPHGDKVLKQAPAEDYYAVMRGKSEAEQRTIIALNGPVIERPMDKADHYVKRCVAVAGDILEIIDGDIYVNSEPQTVWDGVQLEHKVVTKGYPLSESTLSKYGLGYIYSSTYDPVTSSYPALPLTKARAEKMKKDPFVIADSVNVVIEKYNPNLELEIFPFSSDSLYHWTRDNYGPIWIPEKGATVELTLKNLPLYERIISVYEKNRLRVEDGKIYINGDEAQSYRFKQDYYFMMGDNRHNSLDSRYWGFVPEDHVVGKPAMIWLSIDNEKSFPHNIRWDRLFKIL